MRLPTELSEGRPGERRPRTRPKRFILHDFTAARRGPRRRAAALLFPGGMSWGFHTATRRRARVVIAAALVLSGAGQAGPAIAQARTCTRPAEADPVEAGIAPPQFPCNVGAPPPLRRLMREMMRQSPTFTEQVLRIGSTRGLVVRIHAGGPRGAKPYYARTLIRTHQGGARIADVYLYAPLDLVEVLAHEFEHIRERLEGWNLPLLAFYPGSGVSRFADGAFETERAQLIGRQVSREVDTDSCRTMLLGAQADVMAGAWANAIAPE